MDHHKLHHDINIDFIAEMARQSGLLIHSADQSVTRRHALYLFKSTSSH